MSNYIEVHMISNRILLDEFIQMWENVNSNNIDCNIKVLMIDYPEKKFVLKNGIKVEYIKQKTFSKTTYMNQAWGRNELLCHSDVNNANSKYILFYDDWQKPDVNILIEHLKYLNQGYNVCGRRLECDKDGNNCKEDHRYKLIYPTRSCDYGQFYTCNSSTNLDYILKVNGFDNRFNGGTAGEDYDMGMRISRLSVNSAKFIYNGNALCYHYNHDHVGGKIKNIKFDHDHNTSQYKYIPDYKHYGKWENMNSDQFELWWEGPIKYYKCKLCGTVGILDSIQVYYYNRDHNISRCENGLEQIRILLNTTK